MLKHGTTKELSLIPCNQTKDALGSSIFLEKGSLTGMWDASTDPYGKPVNKWKVDYDNGFVGWWEDAVVNYEGKIYDYQWENTSIESPQPLQRGLVFEVETKKYIVVQINGKKIDALSLEDVSPILCRQTND